MTRCCWVDRGLGAEAGGRALLCQVTVDQVARLLEPDRIRPRSPSFAQFERLVREILLSQVAPARGAEAQPPAPP